MIRSITIDHPNEETQCPECGEPIFLGDPAVFDGLRVFCLYRCAIANAAKEQAQRGQRPDKWNGICEEN